MHIRIKICPLYIEANETVFGLFSLLSEHPSEPTRVDCLLRAMSSLGYRLVKSSLPDPKAKVPAKSSTSFPKRTNLTGNRVQ